MKYTKGEWKLTDKDANGAINIYIDVRFEEGLIAIVYGEANAQLIAATPDLYEALKEALITLNVLQNGESAVIREIKQAIAKAEGGK